MKKEIGISLIEILLVVAAVIILALLVASLPQSISSIRKSNNTSLAREIAGKELDFLRKQSYQNLSNGTSNFSDTSLSKLPSPTASFEINDCPEDICTLGEIAKKIKVKVDWVESESTRSVELTTIIAEGGLGQ